MEIKEFYERYWELIHYREEYKPSATVLNTWDGLETINKFLNKKLQRLIFIGLTF